MDVATLRKKKYGSLSGGQKRKVDIARALLPQPSLLLLDEPTTGLDPQSRYDLWEAIHQLNKKDNMTVVLITHYLEEMAACDILNVLIEGNLYYSGDIANFIKYTFLGAYTELFTKTEFSLTSHSFQVLVAWMIGLFILTSLSFKFHKHSKPRNTLLKERTVKTECV